MIKNKSLVATLFAAGLSIALQFSLKTSNTNGAPSLTFQTASAESEPMPGPGNKPKGAVCSSSTECAGVLVCKGGACDDPEEPSYCKYSDESCFHDNECCSSDCTSGVCK